MFPRIALPSLRSIVNPNLPPSFPNALRARAASSILRGATGQDTTGGTATIPRPGIIRGLAGASGGQSLIKPALPPKPQGIGDSFLLVQAKRIIVGGKPLGTKPVIPPRSQAVKDSIAAQKGLGATSHAAHHQPVSARVKPETGSKATATLSHTPTVQRAEHHSAPIRTKPVVPAKPLFKPRVQVVVSKTETECKPAATAAESLTIEARCGKFMGMGEKGAVYEDKSDSNRVIKIPFSNSSFRQAMDKLSVEDFNKYYGEGSAYIERCGDRHYIIMKKIPGVPLSSFSPKVLSTLALQYNRMVNKMISSGIVHNDLVLGNILYDEKTDTVNPVDIMNCLGSDPLELTAENINDFNERAGSSLRVRVVLENKPPSWGRLEWVKKSDLSASSQQ